MLAATDWVAVWISIAAIGDLGGVDRAHGGKRPSASPYPERKGRTMTATVNVVVLAGTVAADPVTRRMPSGDEVIELRLAVPEPEKRLLPLPVAVWLREDDENGVARETAEAVKKGDELLVHGKLVRRFYRSGAGARSLMEVIASGLKILEAA